MRQAGARQVALGWLSALALLAPPSAQAHPSPREARIENQRSQFEAALAAQPSATKALEQWCGLLTGTDRQVILATSVAGQDAPAPRDLHTLLQTDGPPGYRHVRLACRLGTLSEAHNWFVPARLTPEMNATLATTNTPFGKVAAPLHFTREPLASQRGRGPGCPAHTILTHRALLRLPDGQPLALVVECYTVLNLAPPRPILPPITPYDPQRTCWHDSDGHMQGPHCPAPSQAPSPTLP